MAVLDPRFCARAFSSSGERGPLFITVRGPLTIAASLVAEHRLQMRRLSSCGSRAHLLRGMWDLPGPGLEPVSPALAGRFSTTAPPGKPPSKLFIQVQRSIHIISVQFNEFTQSEHTHITNTHIKKPNREAPRSSAHALSATLIPSESYHLPDF